MKPITFETIYKVTKKNQNYEGKFSITFMTNNIDAHALIAHLKETDIIPELAKTLHFILIKADKADQLLGASE